MSSNNNLIAAQRARFDEFYTQLSDIERELKEYREHFSGKTVYCNCDDPTVSNFTRYFQKNFEFFDLKRLITTCYKSRQPNLFSKHDTESAVWLEYVGNGTEPIVRQLEGDGDFKSDECIEFLKQADIVATNPPFSLFNEYIAQLIEYRKKFLVIGNFNAVSYKKVFPLIKSGKVWLGFSPRGMTFEVPNDNGEISTKTTNAAWFTNLDHRKRRKDIRIYRKYAPEEYPKYDNYDAIEVGKVAKIPADYAGEMGVPITFLDKHNPDQFEIIGMDRPLITQLTGKQSRFKINGEEIYARIVIRNRRLQE